MSNEEALNIIKGSAGSWSLLLEAMAVAEKALERVIQLDSDAEHELKDTERTRCKGCEFFNKQYAHWQVVEKQGRTP